MQRRRVLGKRMLGDSGASGSSPKRNRSDQEVPAMDEDCGGPSTPAAGGSSASFHSGGTSRRPGREILARVPRSGTLVERNRVRMAGPYVIGHELGTSPGVPQTQYLARLENTNDFYLLKILSYDLDTEMVNKETQQGKTLLHTEYTILSLLADLDGIIHHHGLFCDFALEEKQVEPTDQAVATGPQWVYTGKVRRRLILVLDCVHSHEFCERSSAYVNLQKYVQSHRFPEIEALMVFYEIVKVVEQLHLRNVIHRDLKLNNIVLNRRTNKIVLTNFFLAKHLNSEDDNLCDQRGSPAYISPDVLGGKPYKGKPSDVWALGVILFTIVYGKFPFLDTTPAALFKKIRQADYSIPLESKASPLTINLIKSMLTLNPTERYTASEVRKELERTISHLRGPRIEVDQIVPEVEEFDVPSQERQKSAAAKGRESTSTTPTYPSHELSREAFSKLLESGIHRREHESFLRPRSLVNRSSSSRSSAQLIRGFSTGSNRVAVFANGSRNSLGSSVPILRNRSLGSVTDRTSSRPEIVQVRIAPLQEPNPIPTTQPQAVAQPPTNQPSPQPQSQSLFVHVDTASFAHFVNAQGSARFAGSSTNPPPTAAALVTQPTFQNPDIQSLFSAMNDLFARGRMPAPPPTREESPDFHGTITIEMATKIVAWLLNNFRNFAVVREIFGSTSGNKVNNVLELLRRFGVNMDSVGGGAVIRTEQTIDVLMLMTYLLQVARMNNNYFLNSY
ncbi:serine/threonine-protein kinase 40 [Culex quinquefasciatus]|uniref:serine/threonine-protein kinase 40 n=1 Tax=Culex quinquefasciatus TaxID=7176 RepID=UPI0018E32AA5|nr:serine/threonine-protein kinase 40 [Culex quinquefasciatus]